MKKTLFASLILVAILASSCAGNSVNTSDNDKKAALFYDHGTQKLVDKDYTQALDFLLKAEQLKPEDTKIQNNLGMAFYFKKQNSKAVEHLKKSLKVDPKNSEARNNLAAIYYEIGEDGQAEREYKMVLEDLLYKSQYMTYYNLALINLKRKKVADAVEFLKKSLKENEDYCAGYFLLGGIYKSQYKYKDALDMFRRGSKGSCTNLPDPLYEQGLIYLEMNNSKQAKEKFQEVIDRFPGTNFEELSKQKIRDLRSQLDNRQYRVMNEQTDFTTPSF